MLSQSSILYRMWKWGSSAPCRDPSCIHRAFLRSRKMTVLPPLPTPRKRKQRYFQDRRGLLLCSHSRNVVLLCATAELSTAPARSCSPMTMGQTPRSLPHGWRMFVMCCNGTQSWDYQQHRRALYPNPFQKGLSRCRDIYALPHAFC